MSTQPLQQTLDVCRETLAAVSADQMQASTPCASWDVAGLINHIVGAQSFFTAGLLGQAPSTEEVDYAAGDYMAAFDQAAAQTMEAFNSEGAMEKMCELPFGTMPGAALMGMAMTDTFQHSWDLAKATGQSTDLAPQLASAILQQSQGFIQEGFRGEDGQAPFGAEQQCADGSCSADQLAAFLGREV